MRDIDNLTIIQAILNEHIFKLTSNLVVANNYDNFYL